MRRGSVQSHCNLIYHGWLISVGDPPFSRQKQEEEWMGGGWTRRKREGKLQSGCKNKINKSHNNKAQGWMGQQAA